MYKLDFLPNLEKAIVVGTQQHRKQYRAQKTELYISHPLRIMQNIRNVGIFDDTCLCAAILHDVVEDTDFTIEDVYRMFGVEIANIVDLLTRTDDVTYDDYIDRLIKSNNTYALIIKFFDAHDNSRWVNKDGSTTPIQKYIDLKEKLRGYINQLGYGSFICYF